MRISRRGILIASLTLVLVSCGSGGGSRSGGGNPFGGDAGGGGGDGGTGCATDTQCGGTRPGCEAALAGDAKNCGGCGKACALANASATCVAGACMVGSCAANFGDCDKSAANGCERPLLSDLNNCGSCGRSCSAAPNSTPGCQ